MLHIPRANDPRRALCGTWHAPSANRPGWANKRRHVKETCPACVRLDKGGKR